MCICSFALVYEFRFLFPYRTCLIKQATCPCYGPTILTGRTTEGRAMSLRHKLRWTHVQCEVCPSPWCSGRPPWDGRKSKDFPSCGGNMSIPGWRCLLGARAAHPLRRQNMWTTTGKTRFMMPKLRETISIPGWRCLLDARAARYGTPWMAILGGSSRIS